MSTYTPISSNVISSNTSSVTFSSIPQNYTDLVLVVNFGTVSTNYISMYLNNDYTVSNYSGTYLLGSTGGSGTGRYTGANGAYWIGGGTTTSENSYGTYFICNLQNYSTNTTFKNVLAKLGNVSNTVSTMTGLWRNTNPITTITLQSQSGTNLLAGSTFNLYGIVSGGGYALGGNTVRTDGTYWYHTFLSSGVFTPTKNLTCDYLVVAGGGSGGGTTNGMAGGGGAGGLRSTVTASGGTPGTVESALNLSANTSYVVTIGAGGASVTSGKGHNGTNSIFHTITSIGGGAGGTNNNIEAAIGGSGGGGGQSPRIGASGIANQGFAGGNGGADGGGGGGGASAVGSNGGISYSRDGGAGGNGRAISITGSSVTYAGGGGGGGYYDGAAGAAGAGGGGIGGRGNGSNNIAAGSGTVNTGGGGGGTGNYNAFGTTYPSGAGGSGIVIVRYAV